MPQKRNPDVLELLRAKAAKVLALAHFVAETIRAAPSGYNRDLQETKAPFMEGLEITENTLRLMTALVPRIEVNAEALKKAFTADVFATDQVLERVAGGMPFREAYHQVKEKLEDVSIIDPGEAIALKRHLGAPMGLDWRQYDHRIHEALEWVKDERQEHSASIQKLFSAGKGKKKGNRNLTE